MKPRKLTTRAVIIALVLIVAGYYLYPTIRYEGLQGRETRLAGQLAEKMDVSNAFVIENLHTDASILEDRLLTMGARLSSADSAVAFQELAELRGELRDKLARNRAAAIKQGLDLQGGMHIVLEVDLVQLMRNLARQRDERLNLLLIKIENHFDQDPRAEFNDIVTQTFDAEEVKLSQYFGEAGESDATVLDYLSSQADDAINRSLEILQNRIDQFGVTEPSIHKQGSRRIVLELPGIQDPARARDLIGRTALLEFKLMGDPDKAQSFLEAADRFFALAAELQDTMLAVTNADSAVAAAPKSADTTGQEAIELGEALTGRESEVAGDTTADLAAGETPFTSLLRGMRGDVAVPRENLRAVRTMLADPLLQNIIPEGMQILWGAKPETGADGTEYHLLYMLNQEPELIGSALKDAQVDISSGSSDPGRAGQSVVSLTLDREGSRKFARVTGANIDKRLAIVLDNRVYMAPVIRSKIPNGRAIIEGLDNVEEANDLAIVLRAGALPTSVVIEEERTVGPSLGRDSIRKGFWSAVMGMILTIVFIVIYYRLSGLIAVVALLLNVVLIFAGLAFFGAMGIGATLSLPGIAGIILTIGMAVDANVLINERIREELGTGKTVWHAISAGYDRAFITILDSNLTTLIAALVLLQFGTGPVRGFAVTLTIGIFCSMFTAVVVTRFIYDFWTNRRTIVKLSI